jgi:hypothetical protein
MSFFSRHPIIQSTHINDAYNVYNNKESTSTSTDKTRDTIESRREKNKTLSEIFNETEAIYDLKKPMVSIENPNDDLKEDNNYISSSDSDKGVRKSDDSNDSSSDLEIEHIEKEEEYSPKPSYNEEGNDTLFNDRDIKAIEREVDKLILSNDKKRTKADSIQE